MSFDFFTSGSFSAPVGSIDLGPPKKIKFQKTIWRVCSSPVYWREESLIIRDG
jgi:hypothetical protein